MFEDRYPPEICGPLVLDERAQAELRRQVWRDHAEWFAVGLFLGLFLGLGPGLMLMGF